MALAALNPSIAASAASRHASTIHETGTIAQVGPSIIGDVSVRNSLNCASLAVVIVVDFITDADDMTVHRLNRLRHWSSVVAAHDISLSLSL